MPKTSIKATPRYVGRISVCPPPPPPPPPPQSMQPSCIRTKSTPTNSASVQRASRNRNFLRWSPPRTRHPRPEVAAPRTIIRSQAALVVNGNDPAQWQFNTQRGEKISGRCSRTNRLLNEHRRRRKPAPPASLLGAQISAAQETHARRLMIARSCNRPLNPRTPTPEIGVRRGLGGVSAFSWASRPKPWGKGQSKIFPTRFTDICNPYCSYSQQSLAYA